MVPLFRLATFVDGSCSEGKVVLLVIVAVSHCGLLLGMEDMVSICIIHELFTRLIALGFVLSYLAVYLYRLEH